MELLGTTVTEIIPVNGTSGNVRASFGVFSYAATFTITVVADTGVAGDLAQLVVLIAEHHDVARRAAEPEATDPAPLSSDGGQRDRRWSGWRSVGRHDAVLAAGWNSSTGLPDVSSRTACLPPGPEIRFHPPAIG